MRLESCPITQHGDRVWIAQRPIPTITDADFTAFKQFLKKEQFAFDTETTLALKNTLAVAKREKLDTAIATEYQNLMVALQKSEENLLNQNQKEIK